MTAPPSRSEETDPTVATPARNFGSGAAARTINEVYADTEAEAASRAIAYGEALQLARRTGIRRVVVFGSRGGDGLIAPFRDSTVEAVGVDLPFQVERARERFPDATWVSCYLGDYDALEAAYADVARQAPQIFVLADVLEHLDDPRPLLRTVRRLLFLDPESRAIVSFADRVAVVGPGYQGMSRNRSHVREWSTDEMLLLLRSAGFRVCETRPAVVHPEGHDPGPAIVVAGADRAGYDELLRKHGLPSSDLERLLIVTKHSLADGRDQAVSELAGPDPAAAGSRTVAVCYLPTRRRGDVPPFDVPTHWLRPEALLGALQVRPLLPLALALAVAEQAVYLYSDIAVVDYPEDFGIGVTISQAKRAGLLPGAVQARVRCLGGVAYREYVAQRWFGWSAVLPAYREKLSVELADVATFPSEAVRQVYVESGYELDPRRVAVGPHPADPPASAAGPGHGPVADVTVIVPCYKSGLRYIEDLIFGLNQQTVRPKRVIFVDDGSGPEYVDQLEATVASHLEIPFDVVRHELNAGAGAARNTGLSLTTTEYLANLDADNIPKNDFILRMVEYFRRVPDAAACRSGRAGSGSPDDGCSDLRDGPTGRSFPPDVLLDDPGRHADDLDVIRDILGHESARADDRM